MTSADYGPANYDEEGSLLMCPPARRDRSRPLMDLPQSGLGVEPAGLEGAGPLPSDVKGELLPLPFGGLGYERNEIGDPRDPEVEPEVTKRTMKTAGIALASLAVANKVPDIAKLLKESTLRQLGDIQESELQEFLTRFEVESAFLRAIIDSAGAGYIQVKNRGCVLEPEDLIKRVETLLSVVDLGKEVIESELAVACLEGLE